MFNQLTALGYGLVIFSIIIGVGSIVLFNFSGTMAKCPADMTGGAWNSTSGTCTNTTGSATPTGVPYTTTAYLLTQFGTAGLAGWAPAIIAISVGLLFLGAFAIGGGGKKKGRY